MSFLSGASGALGSLGGPLAGGAITPLSGLGAIGGPLSGIGALAALFGGHGGGDNDASAPPAASGPDKLLGHILGADPSEVGKIADRIGGGMNKIATAGGADGGYAPTPPAPNNYMQMADPAVLQRLQQMFAAYGGGAGGGKAPY